MMNQKQRRASKIINEWICNGISRSRNKRRNINIRRLFKREKKADGTITEYEVKSDGSSRITIGDKTINVNKDLSVADNTNKVGDSSSTTGKITYTDTTDNTQKPLTKDTAAGTKIGTTTVDGQKLDWYLFDVSDDGKTAYLVSTPTYWVPDTTKEVSGAWVPKLVSSYDSNTNALRQAIQKLSNGTNSYNQLSVSYNPSPNTLSYYKNVNSQWSAQEEAQHLQIWMKMNKQHVI